MLRFSNKVKYGLQFLLFLLIDDEEYTDIQRAAISCNIPYKFLESIAVSLKRHGFANVKRGAGGGYKLSRMPQEIHLAEVVAALEMEKKSDQSDQKEKELTAIVVESTLDQVMDGFWELLEEKTLYQLYQSYNKRTDELMYYI